MLHLSCAIHKRVSNRSGKLGRKKLPGIVWIVIEQLTHYRPEWGRNRGMLQLVSQEFYFISTFHIGLLTVKHGYSQPDVGKNTITDKEIY